ncbi:4-(cytidine 5'-diphospho)-2-C-methyl-D-erythritol kinase [Zhengella sp. ZM62]|uniref:4-(cytidine 5'-diphospho)-2-C-methyl-D-erythritol kinase n=1 Tax=Zhengella sedimenti TaxID=3390035 RepID=UPI003975079C
MHPVQDAGGRWHVRAPAKVNLALHVTGRRPDGYHDLDTLAVFTDFGDRITLEPADDDRFTISGPMAGGLDPHAPNLVTGARDLLRKAHGFGPVAIHLEKHLPVSSGIGGGSSDAAATLRALNAAFGLGLDRPALAALSLPLGADLPMCVHGVPLRARGIGEAIEPLPGFAGLAMVLANPGEQVATPAVFRALARRDNPPLPAPPRGGGAAAIAGWLAQTRNDMQDAAASLCPVIGETLTALAAERPLLARMSGSGATCFALFSSLAEARRAAGRIATAHPAWFVVATGTLASNGESHEPD